MFVLFTRARLGVGEVYLGRMHNSALSRPLIVSDNERWDCTVMFPGSRSKAGIVLRLRPIFPQKSIALLPRHF
jgi:hypothetical protein